MYNFILTVKSQSIHHSVELTYDSRALGSIAEVFPGLGDSVFIHLCMHSPIIKRLC